MTDIQKLFSCGNCGLEYLREDYAENCCPMERDELEASEDSHTDAKSVRRRIAHADIQTNCPLGETTPDFDSPQRDLSNINQGKTPTIRAKQMADVNSFNGKAKQLNNLNNQNLGGILRMTFMEWASTPLGTAIGWLAIIILGSIGIYFYVKNSRSEKK